MPEIIANHDFLNEKPLRLVFNLIAVEHPEKWEGWIYYELKMYSGDELITGQTHLSILDEDVQMFCQLLTGETNREFEPLEPSFQFLLRQVPEKHNRKELLIFLDEGVRRSTGITGQGIGLRLLVNDATLARFADDVKKQLLILTNVLPGRKAL